MWTRPEYDRVCRVRNDVERKGARGVVLLNGCFRRCASQQGNALLYLSRLGFPDERARHLVRLLQRWQWGDGGWNCSQAPDAHVSSFMETLAPMRGLAAYAAATGSEQARRLACRAAEVFLRRQLYLRRSTQTVMRPDFLRLHYPLYWHYDVLGGLKGLAEVGLLEDPRCQKALDWLESRELPQGGWPVDARYYHPSSRYESGGEYVDWGTPSLRRPNDWVTTDALYVLTEAGRLGIRGSRP